MRLDPEILDGAPGTGARILALARLADADDAAARLADPKDRDAPRGFAEALGRLGSTLDALAPALSGVVTAAQLADLRAAARHAGPAREAALFATWLQATRADLAGPYRGALDWLADRVERRRRLAVEELAREAAPRFRRVAPELERELGARHPSAPRRAHAPPAAFGALLAGVLRAQARALREALVGIAGASDAEGLRRARAEGERLRTFLEPLHGSGVKAAEALVALERLESALGGWLDARAAQDGLEGALLQARAEEVRRGAAALAGIRPGLLATLALAERRAADEFRRIDEHLAVKGIPVTDAVYAVVAELEARAEAEAGAATEAGPAERRFLVTGIPPEARGGEGEEIEQGWLPGDARESIGIVRSTAGERWFRARARPAVLEPISRGDFEAFWPLTEGRRVAKRRHLAAAPGWRFEEYLDRPLVLAIADDALAEPPPWLEPVLVRDVSRERGYVDEALARRPPRRAG